MTHDPLCPCTPTGFDIPLRARDEFCLCNLIAKVRFDERQRIIGVMERNADGDAMKVIDA